MRKYVFTFFIVLGLYGCQGWLTIQPETMLSKDEMFASKEGFRDAMMGIYAMISDSYSHRGSMMSTTVEHLACQWSVKKDSKEEALNKHNYNDTRVDSDFKTIFHNAYKAIANANLLLEYVEDTKVLSESDRCMYHGEALALRAFLHFDLLRLWGPIPDLQRDEHKYIPYVRVMGKEINPYNTYKEYTRYLLEDIDGAEKWLKQHEPSKRNRFTYGGLLALKARVYLWLQRDEEALSIARRLRDSLETGEMLRLATYGDVGAYSCEHIVSLACDFEEEPFSVNLENSVLHVDEVYENSASDIRYSWWELFGNADASKRKVLNKYDAGNLVPLFRLTELYFIIIEKGTLTEASEAYRAFCRARMIDYREITNEQERSAVMLKEFRKDYIAEGQLFFYYKRIGLQDMPGCNDICGSAAYVLPLPDREVNLN